MTIDVKEAFSAVSKSIQTFLQVPGQGCYIPAYQREYRWDKNNVDRLFEDIVQGICQLCDRPKTVSFLGTIIAIHDTTYATVKPVHREEMPRPVMTIIDGQQRLSTFILLFIALHNHLSRLNAHIEKADTEADEWLTAQTAKLIFDLHDCVVLDHRTGKGLNRYYPRIIRSFVDVWSSRSHTARYDGPLARLIWQYIEHIHGENSAKEFKPSQSGEETTAYKNLTKVYAHIVSRLKSIANVSEDTPDILAQAARPDFGLNLMGFNFEQSVLDRLANLEDSLADRRFRDCCAALILGHYAQQRVAFTVVETKGEDDAFDMFEALNTTGEPLTAFETFEPRVIEEEGLEDYEHSASFPHVQRVKLYLSEFGDQANKVQKATSSMLVAFALADTGHKLGTKLNEQRRYLRNRFDDPNGSQAFQRRFVSRLADVAEFMRIYWFAKGLVDFSSVPIKNPETIVAFEYLRNLGHTITIPALSRFYSVVVAETEPQARRHAIADFEAAIRSCAAFSALWRGAFGTTSNIDAVYRRLMSDGDGTQALSADPKDRQGTVSLNLLRNGLLAALKDAHIDDLERWKNKVAKCPIYTGSRPTARFLLVAATHDTVQDNDSPGLIKKGRNNTFSTLNPTAWVDIFPMEIEHVAPQSGGGTTWDNQIYEDAETVHALGNLTLLPKNQNIVMSAHPWAKKKAGFNSLAARTEDEFEASRATARAQGLDLPERSEAILASASYSPLLAPLALLDSDWDAEFIYQRSQRLADLAWETIYPWLNPS